MTTIEDIKDWFGELSLATKCLLLFGGASALIITIALSLPLLRMNGLVGAGELELARTVYATWIQDNEPGEPSDEIKASGAVIRSINREQIDAELEENRFLARAIQRFNQSPTRVEHFDADWNGWNRVYRYARAVRDSDAQVSGVVLMEHRADGAGWLLVVNLLYVFIAGAVVLAVALVVYVTIINRLILSPVASLQKTAELVRDGELETRCQIDTGDEFEELAETINLMLAALTRQRDQLRDANKAMDIKLAELAEANSALFESARLKGEFLASVSHELRTPLNAIIGFSDVMKQRLFGPLPARYAEYGDLIHESGAHLLELIGDVLDMSKIEADRYELTPEEFDARDVVKICAKMLRLKAEESGLALYCETGDLPLQVEADRKAVRQILLNLLSNAVKFTPAGGAVVVMARAQGPDLVLAVGDSGVGISADELETIGRPYAQSSSGKTTSERGTGLGLTLVRALAELHGGAMSVQSAPGEGTTVTVRLPVMVRADITSTEREDAPLEVHARIRAAQEAGLSLASGDARSA